FGKTFFEKKKDEDVIGTPQAFEVEVEVAGDDRGLTKAVKNASILWNDRKKPASGAAGLIAKAKGDYRKILDALYARALYGGTISITIDGREASGLRADSEFSDPAMVVVSVTPGPEFTFD